MHPFYLLLVVLLALFQGVIQAQNELFTPKVVCGSYDRKNGYCTDPQYWQKFADALRIRLFLDPNLGPKFVRLAFHAAGTYDVVNKTYGINGGGIMYNPMRQDPQNAGLHITIDLIWILLQDFPEISCADALAAASIVSLDFMQGPAIEFRPGRRCFANEADAVRNAAPTGLLPDALTAGDAANTRTHNRTVSAFRRIFTRLGFNDQETVALMGAHSMGQARLNNTGYRGRWTAVSYLFGNGFFRNLVNQINSYQQSTPTAETKLQYNLVKVLNQEVLMMLPSDMGMYYDTRYSPFVRLYAQDADRFERDFAAAFTKLINLGVETRLGPVMLRGQHANSAFTAALNPLVISVLVILSIALMML